MGADVKRTHDLQFNAGVFHDIVSGETDAQYLAEIEREAKKM